MTPSPDDILACETPFDLFGESVSERRALKRSYAGLIKAYDPDGHPEVFRHIRALYERARAGDTGRPPVEQPTLRLVQDEDEHGAEAEAEAEAETEGAPAAPSTPSERLQEAMKAGDADTALAILDAHDLDVRIETPGVWFATVAALADARTFDLPAPLLQSWLDAIEHPPDGMPEPLLERIELLTSTGLAFQRAQQDPAIAAPLLDLLRHWGQPPPEVAQAFLELGEALPDPQAARDAHHELKERHPGLWFPYTLMANLVTREVDTFDESTSELLHAPPDPTWVVGASPALRRGLLVARVTRLAGSVGMAVCAVVAFATYASLAWTGFAVAAACSILGAVALPVLHQRIEQAHGRTMERLLACAREGGLFPHEALDLALAADPHAPQAPLLDWQQDPTTLMRVLTPAHLDRVAARTIAERAAAAAAQENAE